MAAKSNDKYDVYDWIVKVYDSCETLSQLLVVNKLVENFKKMYPNDELNWELHWYKNNIISKSINFSNI